MKGVAIAARFTRRRGVICGKWAAPAGAVHLEFALAHNEVSSFVGLSQEKPLRSQYPALPRQPPLERSK
jgi:hypothetical protein